jgi:hypothetical protein
MIAERGLTILNIAASLFVSLFFVVPPILKGSAEWLLRRRNRKAREWLLKTRQVDKREILLLVEFSGNVETWKANGLARSWFVSGKEFWVFRTHLAEWRVINRCGLKGWLRLLVVPRSVYV